MTSKKILTRLMDYVADRRVAWGPEWTGPVVLTAKEHNLLKTEIGSSGGAEILSIEGVKILIGSQSDLPPVPTPDLKTAAATVPAEWLAPTLQGIVVKPAWEPDVSLDWTQSLSSATQPELPLPLKATKVYHKSMSDEHGTPQALFDRLDHEFHFDLDVCATAPHEVEAVDSPLYATPAMFDPGNAKCPIYFTKEDDGLTQQWFGRVWMNPPYTHGQVGVWIQKLLKELIAGRITLGVALTAARPDTQWFQTVASYACDIRFLKGRLTFEGQKNAAPFPSVVLVFDPTKQTQIVKFWDWQTGHAPVYWKTPGYTFVPGKAGKPGMALPSLKGLASGSKLALVK